MEIIIKLQSSQLVNGVIYSQIDFAESTISKTSTWINCCCSANIVLSSCCSTLYFCWNKCTKPKFFIHFYIAVLQSQPKTLKAFSLLRLVLLCTNQSFSLFAIYPAKIQQIKSRGYRNYETTGPLLFIKSTITGSVSALYKHTQNVNSNVWRRWYKSSRV